MEYKSTWVRWIDTRSGQSIYWSRPDGLDYESMDSILYMFNILLTRQTQTQDTCVRLEGQLHELRSELHTQVQSQVYASVPITASADVPKNPITETKENQNLSEIKYPDWKSESNGNDPEHYRMETRIIRGNNKAVPEVVDLDMITKHV